MSATDELRRMLDERGVEYQYVDKRGCVPSCEVVAWLTEDDDLWQYSAEYSVYHDGSTLLEFECSKARCTPAQAIAATLGRGECHVVSSIRHEYEGGYAGTEWEHELSCGHKTWWSSDDPPEWCPWCGRKVVDA